MASASATPTLACSPVVTDAASMPSGGGNGAADGSGSGFVGVGGAIGVGNGVVGGAGAQVQAHEYTNTANAIIIDADAVLIEGPPAKRVKKCHSDVWQYFDKEMVIIEDHGKVYQQQWACCKYEKCKFKGRCNVRAIMEQLVFGHI